MFLEQQIRVISEGSCDTEDWSNDDKMIFDHRNKLKFIIYYNRKVILNYNNISLFYWVLKKSIIGYLQPC